VLVSTSQSSFKFCCCSSCSFWSLITTKSCTSIHRYLHSRFLCLRDRLLNLFPMKIPKPKLSIIKLCMKRLHNMCIYAFISGLPSYQLVHHAPSSSLQPVQLHSIHTLQLTLNLFPYLLIVSSTVTPTGDEGAR
jgi:hypothetical protein